MNTDMAEIDVYWLEQTQADIPAQNYWLSQTETHHLDTLRFPKRRDDWLLGRWTAKRAVGAWLGMRPAPLEEIEIRSAASGAPEVYLMDRPAPIAISLSHRAGLAACAVAPPGVALGCDLEIAEPRDAAFIADYFTAKEQAWIEQAPAEERPRLAALFWSAKESALKALRTGLRLDTRSLNVALEGPALEHDRPHGWRPLCARYNNADIFHGWWRQTGTLLRTLVAAPAPLAPLSLRPAHWHSAAAVATTALASSA
jgi:4'-phosphopantetheinyl transferase